jgi:hypothetical protein
VRPRQVSGTHVHVPAAQVKFSLPGPLGQEQLTVEHPLLMGPHAVPMPGVAGHVGGAQQTFGSALSLQ